MTYKIILLLFLLGWQKPNYLSGESINCGRFLVWEPLKTPSATGSPISHPRQ
jgi:hypothetical protein